MNRLVACRERVGGGGEGGSGKGFEVKQRAWSQATPHSYASPSIATGDPRISDIFCNFVVSNQRGVCPEKGITN